ncbi:hypothetical protein [Brevundimonas sp.]|uniref:hypothetical protein n=1 Tax=Brevundimonas sp. TaxID=1871086 RepID=UPI0035AEFCBD
MPKPLALPNVTPDAIAIEAYRLFGADLEFKAEQLRFEQTKREVAENGVDPQELLALLREASADQTDRLIRERTRAQYADILRSPVRYGAGYGDLLEEEPAPETEGERTARIQDEGFWAFITHQPTTACPYEPLKDDADWEAWMSGFHRARELIGVSD